MTRDPAAQLAPADLEDAQLTLAGWINFLVFGGGVAVSVLNAHLNANYSGDWSPANPAARILREQARQFAHWVHDQPKESLVIVCGDFNFPRDSFLYGSRRHLPGGGQRPPGRAPAFPQRPQRADARFDLAAPLISRLKSLNRF